VPRAQDCPQILGKNLLTTRSTQYSQPAKTVLTTVIAVTDNGAQMRTLVT